MNDKVDTTFEGEFRRRVSDIKRRAKDAGTSITALCKATGMARATPDRWEDSAPKTIKLVDQLEQALQEAEKAAGIRSRD